MSKLIRLTRGYSAVIDDADHALVAQYRWHARVDNHVIYAARNAKREGGGYSTLRLHTFLTGWDRVDHIDGDGLNNRRSNLRPASALENNQNASKRAPAYSKYKGVSWCKREGRWFAQIQHNRSHRHLGYYPTEVEAAVAYDAASRELFGPFARPNFATEAVA